MEELASLEQVKQVSDGKQVKGKVEEKQREVKKEQTWEWKGR